MNNNTSIEINKEEVITFLKHRNPDSHKGDYGHVLLMVGSYGKMGAAVLASRACLRSGVGLLTAFIPACGYEIMQTAIPEAMVVCSEGEEFINSTIDFQKYDAIGLGCGLGTHLDVALTLTDLLKQYKKPMVIDADAINILARNRSLIQELSPGSILTPHPREFDRLAGPFADEADMFEKQINFSVQHQVYIVLKGHLTRITTPEGKIYRNTSGNPGMAKGGSGDVLTGILTSLLGQGYSPLESCVLGVFIHGLAGDLAVKSQSECSLIASDIIDYIGKAFSALKK